MKQCLKILVLILGLSFLATSCVKRNRDADATSPFLGTWVDSTYLNSYRKSKNADSLCYLGKNSNGKVQYNVSIQTINARGGIQYGQLDLKSLKTDYSEDRTSEVSNSGVIRGSQKESYKYTYSLSEDGKKLTSRFYYADPQGVMKASEEEFDLYNSDELYLIGKDLEGCDEAALGGDNVEDDKDITAEFFKVVSGRYEFNTGSFLEFGSEKLTLRKFDSEHSFLKKDDARTTELLHDPEKHSTNHINVLCTGMSTYDNITVRKRSSKEKTVKYDGIAYKGYGGETYMTYLPKSQDYSQVKVSYTQKETLEYVSLPDSEFNKDFAIRLCEIEFFEHPEIEFLVSWDKERIITTRYDVNSESGPTEKTYRKVNQ